MRQLLAMKVGPPAMVGQSRDANWSVRLSGRPLALQRSSRKSRDETRDERESGWHRTQGERASMTRRPPTAALSINFLSDDSETKMAGMRWGENQEWHPGEPPVRDREMLLGRSEGSSHPP